jgi:hypothetical protein
LIAQVDGDPEEPEVDHPRLDACLGATVERKAGGVDLKAVETSVERGKADLDRLSW